MLLFVAEEISQTTSLSENADQLFKLKEMH